MHKPRPVSNRHLTVALVAALAGLSSAPLCAQTIASWNFDGDTVGQVNASNPVSDFTLALPSSSITVGPAGGVGGALSGLGGSGDVGVAVVGATNTLGAGDTALFGTSGNKFLRFFDRDNGTGGSDNVSLRLNDPLAGTSPLQMLSFDFANTQYTSTTASQASGLFVAISLNDDLIPGANSAASVNNAARIELFRFSSTVGRITVTNSSSATGGISSSAVATYDFSLASAHKFRIVINDAATSASYSIGSTATTLAANRYAVWIDNDLVINDRLMRSNHTGGTEGFSRFALGTTNGTGVDWAVDNLTVSAIPEPSAFAAVAGLGALGLVALRRRSRVA